MPWFIFVNKMGIDSHHLYSSKGYPSKQEAEAEARQIDEAAREQWPQFKAVVWECESADAATRTVVSKRLFDAAVRDAGEE